jgi:cytochrome b561
MTDSNFTSQNSAYTSVAKWLHWTMAVLIILMVGYGWSMDELEGSELSNALSYHALGGITVFILVVMRYLWRKFNPPPALSDGLSTAQKLAAKFIHITLYILMFLVPMTGLITAVAHNVEVVVLGTFDLQKIFSFLGYTAFDLKRAVHHNLMNLMLGLIIGHIGAAIVHRYWLKDTVVGRMT